MCVTLFSALAPIVEGAGAGAAAVGLIAETKRVQRMTANEQKKFIKKANEKKNNFSINNQL